MRILQQLTRVPDRARTRAHTRARATERKSPAWVMARLDRGRYARPVGRWHELFSAAFEPVVVEPYFFGGGLWSMIYFQGRAKS